MSLIEKINADFKTAFKNREMEKKDFLGLLKTEVTKATKTPEDKEIVATIKSMIKNAAKTNSLSETELEILNDYLPKQMTKEELTLVINELITINNLSEKRDMGKVMGDLKSNYGGQYDGGMASKIVKEMLS